MMRVSIFVSILSVVVLFSPTLSASDADKLVGAWERVYSKNLDTGEVLSAEMWPSILIYSKKHYSWITAASDRRIVVDKTSDQLTESELRDMFRFGANAGSYEVSGNTLTVRRRLAKGPCVEGAVDTEEFRFEGDELILRCKTINRKCTLSQCNWEARWRRID